MIETYSIWNLHGEQLDHASSSNATRVDNVEPIVDPNEQVMDIIHDAFPFASTNINQEGEDDVPTPMDRDHEWREKDKEFNGNTERRLRPREWSGDEILEQLNRLDFAPFGKTVTRTRPSTHLN
ncbi:unnamed protein product, partial [Prunus brigantina]